MPGREFTTKMGDLFGTPRSAPPHFTNFVDPMSRRHVSRDKLCTFLLLRHMEIEIVGSYEGRAKNSQTEYISN